MGIRSELRGKVLFDSGDWSPPRLGRNLLFDFKNGTQHTPILLMFPPGSKKGNVGLSLWMRTTLNALRMFGELRERASRIVLRSPPVRTRR